MYECVYSTSDYSDMVYLVSMSFNKVVDIQFNSTVGEFVGYTEQGVEYAENFNKNKELVQGLKAGVDTICKPNAQTSDTAVRDKTGECYKTLVSSLLHNKDLTMCVHWRRRTPLKMHETGLLFWWCCVCTMWLSLIYKIDKIYITQELYTGLILQNFNFMIFFN